MSDIFVDDYFRDAVEHFGYTPTEDERVKALDLLERVNTAIADYMGETGLPEPQLTSGYRCRAKSEELIAHGYKAAINGHHEHAEAVDVSDGGEHFESWWTDEKLEKYGLYREAPASTIGWVHLQNVPPNSQHRTFNP